MFVTVYSGVTLNADLATGAFDRFRSMHVWRPAPILGALIGDIGRCPVNGDSRCDLFDIVTACMW